MNRGQVKRIRKELERLRKGEKEWEALRLIEGEGACEEFAAEWNDLWRSRTRRALRTAQHLEEFLAQSAGFASLPDNADLRFLQALGEHLADGMSAADIGLMTGLSAPAETLRRELLRLGGLSLPDEPKLRAQLMSFAMEPEGALQKDYRQLRALLAFSPAVPAEACESFEELLTRSRKLNSATAVKKKASGVSAAELGAVDRLLKEAGSPLPEQLFKLLAAPVLTQVAKALRRVAEHAPERAAGLALSAPFCMQRLSGSAWPALSRKLRLDAGQKLSAEDRAMLLATARSADFEERFLLVEKLARILTGEREPDLKLYDAFAVTFQGIFRELTLKRAALPEREQRRLAQVMGPVLRRHLPLLWGSDADLPFILDDAAAAGCLDPSSALMHAFFAAKARDRGMTAKARAMLKLLPPIQEPDVQHFFEEYQELIAEDARDLKAMLTICRESGHELAEPVAKGLWMTLMSLLTLNSLAPRGKTSSFMDMLAGSVAEDTSRSCKKLLKGTAALAGEPAFAPVVAIAETFPDGRITGTGYGLMARKQVADGIALAEAVSLFAILLAFIDGFGRASEMELPFGQPYRVEQLVGEVMFGGLNEFVADNKTVERLDSASLARLAEIVRQFGRGRNTERYLQLIGNSAARRMQAGDEAMGKLHACVMESLAPRKKPATKRGRR